MVYWDGDDRKDLLVGQTDGTLKLFLNVGTDDAPHFGGGALLQVGQLGSKTDIDMGSRATPIVADWDSDGRKDLVVGAIDGKVRVFVNEGTDTEPDFITVQFAQEDGVDLVVPSLRSSPEVLDLDYDGKKDLLTGDTYGQLLLYANSGTDETPSFSGYVLVEADGAPIDLPGSARSRPFVCDWTTDGFLDVLMGAGDGLVRLYQGVPAATVEWAGQSPATRVAGLLPVYPNPFGPCVTIPFVVSRTGNVNLSVHDVSGRCVARLADGVFEGGSQQIIWDGQDDRGRYLPSGIYFVRIETRDVTDTAKLLILR